ncbi:MAG: hypothetical protein RSE21_03155 [Bacilli bacterium]
MEEKKTDFDLSVLSLNELVGTYTAIQDFIKYLDEAKIEQESGEEDE